MSSDSDLSLLSLDVPQKAQYVGGVGKDYIGGGQGLNVLRGALESCPDKTKLTTHFVGIVGDDDAAEILIECIKETVTHSDIIRQANIPTLSPDTITNRSRYFGSSLLLDGQLMEISKAYKYIFIPGSLLSVFEGVDTLLKYLYFLSNEVNEHNVNKLICMSFGGAEIIADHEDKLKAVIPFIDIVFGTEEEAREFGIIFFGDDKMSIRDIAAYIAGIGKVCNLRPRIVVFTLIDGSCLVATVGCIFEVPANESYGNTMESLVSWEDRQFTSGSNLGGINTTITDRNVNVRRMDYFIGGFLAILLSIENQFDHTRSLCGPRARVTKQSPKRSTSPTMSRPNTTKSEAKSIPGTANSRVTTSMTSKSSSSTAPSKKKGIIDPNRTWSRQEKSKFYHTHIFPPKKEKKSDEELEIDLTKPFIPTEKLKSSVATGVKSLTECVLGGQMAQMNANDLFSFNFKENFYGANTDIISEKSSGIDVDSMIRGDRSVSGCFVNTSSTSTTRSTVHTY